ncbi:MAG TPA: beta-ketoacyl synthase N-terminal-like domain-containing protein, partial [Streptosporangiaceae bacterium]|nr:beta-ketoacyl synthase N-terminal-like domain-containing protein [Streptosporangiaceae bacterium]
MDRETVVVTGLGATTPLGGDVASTWAGMLAGRSGVQPLTEPWAQELPVRIAAPAAVDPV